MENDVIARMRAEETDLLRKLKAVRDFLAAYGDIVPSDSLSSVRSEAKRPQTPARGKVGIGGYSNYGRRIVAEAMRAMLTQSHPMKSRQIVEAITAMGIDITGENKVNALGALLYRSADIESHGKAGWTLRDRDTALKIVADYGHNANGAAEAAPETEGVAPPSSDSFDL